jgi:hypothetical protein
MDGPDCIYVKQTKTPTGCTAIFLAYSLTNHARKERKKEGEEEAIGISYSAQSVRVGSQKSAIISFSIVVLLPCLTNYLSTPVTRN